MKQVIKKSLSLVLALCMVFSLATTSFAANLTGDTGKETVYLSYDLVTYTSTHDSTTAATADNTAASKRFETRIFFNYNAPADAESVTDIKDSLCGVQLGFTYDDLDGKITYASASVKLAGSSESGYSDADNSVFFTWGNGNGLTQENPETFEVEFIESACMAYIGFKSSAALTDEELATFLSSFKLLASYTDTLSVSHPSLVKDGNSKSFFVIEAPAINVTVAASPAIDTDSTAADVKAALTGLDYIDATGTKTSYGPSDAAWADLTVELPAGGLVVGDNTCTAKYQGYSTTFQVTASKVISSIAVTTQPTLTYTSGDSLDLSGMVVTATYSDSTTAALAATEYTVSIANGTAMKVATHNGQKITVTATAKTSVTTETNALTVSKKSVAVPTAAGTYTYTGSSQTFTIGNNTDSAFYTVSGDTSGTNADTYNATVTLKDTAESDWAATFDGTLSWTIAKKTPAAEDFVFTAPADLAYNGEAKAASVVAASGVSGMGTVTVNYSPAGATDVGSYTVSIDVAEGTNYTAASGLTTPAWTFNITNATIADVSVAQSGTLTYTGSAQIATVTATPDTSNTKTVSFTYCDTESGSYAATVPSFTDAGDHTVYYKAAADNHDTASGSFTVKIGKATISNPTVAQSGTLTYTGAALTATVTATPTTSNTQPVTFTYCDTENGTYTATVPSFTDAGTHTVYFKADAANHETATGSFKVTIAAATLTGVSASQNGTLSYNNTDLTATVTENATAVNSQPVTFYYSTASDGEFSTEVPAFKEVGTHTVYYYATAPNHAASAKASFNVTIGKGAALTGLTAEFNVYFGNTEAQPFAIGNVNGLPADISNAAIKTGSASIVSDTESLLNSGALAIDSFKLADGLTEAKAGKSATYKVQVSSDNYSDSDVTVTVNVVNVTFTVGDAAATADNAMTVTDAKLVYGNTWGDIVSKATGFKATVNGKNDETQANFKLYDGDTEMELTDIPAAGSHTIKVKYSGTIDSKTYTNVLVASKDVTVAQKEVALTWTNDALTYNGADQKPDVAITEGYVVSGDTLTVSVTAGAQANAGTGLTATATLAGADVANYKIKTGDATHTFAIAKADPTADLFDLPTIAATGVNYDGAAKSVTAPTVKISVTGMGTTVTVKYGGEATEPTNYKEGGYAVTFDVSEGTNYNAATGLEIGTLNINRLTLTPSITDVAGKKWDGTTAVNDTAKIALTGALAADAATVAATATIEWTSADVGTTSVKATNIALTDAAVNNNYVLSFTDIDYTAVAVTISKADAISGLTASFEVNFTDTAPQSVSAGNVSGLPGGIANAVIKTGSISDVVDTNSLFAATPTEAGFQLADGLTSDAIDKTATYKFVLVSDNFEDSTVEVTVKTIVVVPGGGGGSATPKDIKIPAFDHGTVTADPAAGTNGETITLTVTPEKGYTLETITVTTSTGRKLELTPVVYGEKYTFTMPAGAVDVTATFMDDNTMLNFFVDVLAKDYFYDAVLWAVTNDITSGTDEIHFSPNASCTRGQMVTFLWRYAGRPEPTTTECPFTDVEKGSYYEKAVLWAVENGITHGTSATTFSPADTVTRGQTVAFLMNYCKPGTTSTDTPFEDVSPDAYYAKAVAWAVEKGITHGTSETSFSPMDDCLRGQIVTFIYNCFEK